MPKEPTTTIVRIEGMVECKTHRARGGNWIAICDPLKITLQADSWANLMEDIALTLDAILKDLLGNNELPKFMKDHGWKLLGSIPKRRENMRFDLPFYPIKKVHDSQTSLSQ